MHSVRMSIGLVVLKADYRIPSPRFEHERGRDGQSYVRRDFHCALIALNHLSLKYRSWVISCSMQRRTASSGNGNLTWEEYQLLNV